MGSVGVRLYVVVAIAVGGILGLIVWLDTNQAIASFIEQLGGTARSAGLAGSVVNLVVAPLVYSMTEPIGAVFGALMWPLLLLWMLLLLLVMIYAIIMPTILRLLSR